MEYKIIDPEGNEIPRDQQGELCLKGPNIMLGTKSLGRRRVNRNRLP